MTDKLRKVSLRLSDDLVNQLDEYASMSSQTRTAFMTMAMVIGMKQLARAIAPEKFVTPELVQAFQSSGFMVGPQGADSDED